MQGCVSVSYKNLCLSVCHGNIIHHVVCDNYFYVDAPLYHCTLFTLTQSYVHTEVDIDL